MLQLTYQLSQSYAIHHTLAGELHLYIYPEIFEDTFYNQITIDTLKLKSRMFSVFAYNLNITMHYPPEICEITLMSTDKADKTTKPVVTRLKSQR